MKKQNDKFEVLLPAGDFDSVVAAVQNGADAIFLGQTSFSARQFAKNFDENTFTNAIIYSHARGVKVYQTLNTLIFDYQIDECVANIKTALNVGVDGFIIQDLGVLNIIRQLSNEVPVHASTQMAVHTTMGSQILRDLSFSRVVLAREISINQIKEIINEVDIETEVFVHGTLCMSVSGQCYMSSIIGTRSGNRGNCAGTCRLPFSSTKKEAFDLSLKDLCLSEHTKELMEIGVSSIKIEGRMKRPEYVAAAADVYKKASSGLDFETDTLKSVFSRSGFTSGYLENKLSPDMFGIRKKEDVVSATNKLLKKLENTYQKENGRIKLDLEFSLKTGQPSKLIATDVDKNTITITGQIPEIANNIQSTQESLTKSLKKLGSTIFIPNIIKCDIDDGLILPVSEINNMRRNACDNLLKTRSKLNPYKINDNFCFKLEREKIVEAFSFKARFESFNQINFKFLSKFSSIILPIDEIIENIDKLTPYKDIIIIEPYRMAFENEKSIIEKLLILKNVGFNNLCCNNISHIQMAKSLNLVAFGGGFLNCINSFSLNEYKKLGLKNMIMSPEMNISSMNHMSINIPIGSIIYGYLPLMISRNCPIKNQFSCEECGMKKGLSDRTGAFFPVRCNHKNYSEIFNNKPIYMADKLDDLSSLSFGVLYFTIESESECSKIISNFENQSSPPKDFTRGLFYRKI